MVTFTCRIENALQLEKSRIDKKFHSVKFVLLSLPFNHVSTRAPAIVTENHGRPIRTVVLIRSSIVPDLRFVQDRSPVSFSFPVR